jgi:hypothetical protein
VTTVSGPAAMRSSIRERRTTHPWRTGGVIFVNSMLLELLDGCLADAGDAGTAAIRFSPHMAGLLCLASYSRRLSLPPYQSLTASSRANGPDLVLE